MQRIKAFFRIAGELILLLTLAPLLTLLTVAAIAINDLLGLLLVWRQDASKSSLDEGIISGPVSVVIPTWNGYDHLVRNLPSVLEALSEDSNHEIIVVDNASTDGTHEMLNRLFPEVHVLRLESNLGFGGGSNAGFRAAQHNIVVLLNNDMSVKKDFLAPLLDGFRDPRVFAVSSQIFFSDPSKRREETGLTQGRWCNGRLSVGHVADDEICDLFPTFYAGGGSSAYDRQKFLTLGGFDPLWEPFYLEDTDISYNAWKHGWMVLYQPRSIVYHDHRGTIGRDFSSELIRRTLEKNHLLFAWKNLHDWQLLSEHFGWLYAGLWIRLLGGSETARPNFSILWCAFCQLMPALTSRNHCRQLAVVDDIEAFRRPLAGYFRDRFQNPNPNRDKLNVLFVSPYPIEPPLHGGALFMNQTVRHLALLARVHLLAMLDEESNLAGHRKLDELCTSTEFVIRSKGHPKGLGGLVPHAIREFANDDFDWRLHRAIYIHEIDILQLEYTQLASYGKFFECIATFLFEHDIYFQSVSSGLRTTSNPVRKLLSGYEYLRALRFELKALQHFDGVQTCTMENRRYLESFIPQNSSKVMPLIQDDLRASIDLARYKFVEEGRQADTLLFVGSFQHTPNLHAISYFIEQILPIIRTRRHSVRLLVAGAQAPPDLVNTIDVPGVQFLGRVDDIRELYATCSIFVCPILNGSGIRVKLLEAFAVGIPAVSTALGAEGLSTQSGEIIELAETPDKFADATISLLENPIRARSMARRARREVEERWSAEQRTNKLEHHYREVLRKKIGSNSANC
ncbi:MAG: glycosyl transferase [Solibacterales bacterium]|nr:glycosyl transferase [Bryobacterales bacterium]|tara:strand:- start:44953 stop:47337 length:2385 start_codon:yes stop_codon:yes gene_type:complete